MVFSMEKGSLSKNTAHLAGLAVAALALHLGLEQWVVGVSAHVTDAGAQLGQAAPRVAVQLVEHLGATRAPRQTRQTCCCYSAKFE